MRVHRLRAAMVGRRIRRGSRLAGGIAPGLAPLALVDYVIAHELDHVVRGDDGHSPAFWAELGRVIPDYAARRDALRALGPWLEW